MAQPGKLKAPPGAKVIVLEAIASAQKPDPPARTLAESPTRLSSPFEAEREEVLRLMRMEEETDEQIHLRREFLLTLNGESL